jgi:hypothetical protein
VRTHDGGLLGTVSEMHLLSAPQLPKERGVGMSVRKARR